jgi:hypothetical protein
MRAARADTLGVSEAASTSASTPIARERDGADRVAVALELAPLLAVFMPFFMAFSARWEAVDIDTMLTRAAVIAMLSGLGWMKVRRPMRGLAILVGRGLVLTLLMWWAYDAVSAEVAVRQCEDVCDGPLIPSMVPIVVLVGVFVASTVASAALVARVNRRNAADTA